MIDLISAFFKEKKDEIQDAKIHFNDVKVDEVHGKAVTLELQHERLKLVTMAMWELIRDHTGLTESDLKRYVEKIDLIDGKRDGRITRFDELTTCPACSRKVLMSSLVCAYCGTPLPLKKVFDGI